MAADQPPTAEWLAAQEFAPWDVADIVAPTPQAWAAEANQTTLMLQMAVRTMGRTKAELVQNARDLGPESFATLAERLIDTREWFESWTNLLNAAEARMRVAAAVLEIEESAT